MKLILGRPWLDSRTSITPAQSQQEGSFCWRRQNLTFALDINQDAEQEDDLDLCRARHIPCFSGRGRGGLSFLDGRQLFYQLVLCAIIRCAGDKTACIAACWSRWETIATRRRGQIRPVNDIVTQEGRRTPVRGRRDRKHLVLVGTSSSTSIPHGPGAARTRQKYATRSSSACRRTDDAAARAGPDARLDT